MVGKVKCKIKKPSLASFVDNTLQQPAISCLWLRQMSHPQSIFSLELFFSVSVKPGMGHSMLGIWPVSCGDSRMDRK